MKRAALLAAAVVAGAALPAGSATSRPGWTTHGPDGGLASLIEIDPASPKILYAGTGGAGVFRSTDGGRTWDRRSNGLPANTAIGTLELAPSDPRRLYVLGDTGSFTSADAGATWSRLPGLGESPRSFLVDPSRALTLYASIFSGLMKSTDGGRSWSALPFRFQGPIAIAPSASNVLYGETYGALYRSADYGMSWTQVTNFSYSSIGLIEVDPRDPNTVYWAAGGDLYKSTQGGANPREIREREGLSDVRAFEIDPRAPATLYAGTEGDGVFRSPDGGATWSRAGSLPAHAVMIDIEVAPSAGSPVYATVYERGVFKSENAGSRWAGANQGLVASQIRALAVDPSAPSIVYASTPTTGVWRTRDAGRHWSLRGFAGEYVNHVAVAPRRPHVVWAAVGRDLYRSGDRGRTWKRRLSIKDRSFSVVAVAPSNPRFVYAGTFERGLYHSANGGRTWRAPDLRPQDTVSSILVHPRRPQMVWVGMRGTVLRSHDGGVTFSKPSEGVPLSAETDALALDPRNSRRLYAAGFSGVYRSRNDGANWTRVSNEFSWQVDSVALDRKRPNVLYACGHGRYGGGALYRSTDRARTWTDVSAGLTTTICTPLAFTPNGKRLYVGSRLGGGVFAADVR
jgi:photosystem II stability/assembly factor-like uncharacterized protein